MLEISHRNPNRPWPHIITNSHEAHYTAALDAPRYPVPAVIYHVYLPTKEECGSIWEYSKFHCEPLETTYNRRVMVLSNEKT